MKAEIIAVGTELLMGYIVNTNASDIAQELLDIGIGTYYQSVVGDNAERINEALEIASKRSDIIILSGGLGPTEDDITKIVLADFLNEEIHYDEKQLDILETYFKNQGRFMTPNNKRQAMAITNGKVIANDVGLATGTIYTKVDNNRTQYFVVIPGPPYEMNHMLKNHVKPFLVNANSEYGVIKSCYINFYGIGESAVATELDDLIQSQTNPTIAIYAKPKRVTVRLTASSDSESETELLLESLATEIRSRLSDNYIGDGEDQSFEKYIVDQLIEKKLNLSVAESLTGGLVMEKLTEVPGASKVIKGGFVTYQTEQKEDLLKVPHELIESNTVVSAQVAQSMAENTLKLTTSDIAISLTGVAGPGPSQGHPAGEVFIALAAKNHPTYVRQLNISNKPRQVVREIAKYEVLGLVDEFLNK